MSILEEDIPQGFQVSPHLVEYNKGPSQLEKKRVYIAKITQEKLNRE